MMGVLAIRKIAISLGIYPLKLYVVLAHYILQIDPHKNDRVVFRKYSSIINGPAVFQLRA